MTGRTLLGVWAHPDDEAYMSAGLMAQYRRAGNRVAIVMATLGERGTDNPDKWPPDKLASVRFEELRHSLAILDVDELHVLGYPDGGCQPIDGTDVVACYIRDIQPDVIVTFGPDGMTGHPDHRAVSRWTTNAWASTRPCAQLWYATVTEEFHRRWTGVNESVGFFAEQREPPSSGVPDLAHSSRLPEHLLDLKLAALEAHTSQTRHFVERLGRSTYREWWATESFRRAAATHATGLVDPAHRGRGSDAHPRRDRTLHHQPRCREEAATV
ncbi:MAG: family deacetylase [Acidimicrobiia bacterium]|nr:family deacetylase [Acidimicrobiia bacterium]